MYVCMHKQRSPILHENVLSDRRDLNVRERMQQPKPQPPKGIHFMCAFIVCASANNRANSQRIMMDAQ